MFLSRNKKNNVYPCKSQFYYIKVGFKGVKITKACFCDDYFIQIVTGRKSGTNIMSVFKKYTETYIVVAYWNCLT